MDAFYELYSNPSENQKEEGLMHARLVPHGTIDMDKLSADVARSTAYSKGVVGGVICDLMGQIEEYLKAGYHVELGDMGYLSVSLKSRPVHEGEKLRAGSVHFKDINLRITKDARRRMQDMSFVHCPKEWSRRPEKQDYDPKRLDEYLEKYACISRSEYMKLTGMSSYKAIKDLNRLTEEGRLRRYGRGRNIVYLPINANGEV